MPHFRALAYFAGTFAAATIALAPTTANVAHAKKSVSVLFVGNSHLVMPGFMKRVERRIAKTYKLNKRVVAKTGWTLGQARREAGTSAALKSRKWDVIVLQESTTAFMTSHGRRNFMASVAWFRRNKPAGAKLLLWQPWPQGASHALYRRAGVWGKWFKRPPKSPKQLFEWIATHTSRAAKTNGARIVPIGRCWMRLPRSKQPYASDDYHASGRGLTFIARILSRSVVAAKSTGRSDC